MAVITIVLSSAIGFVSAVLYMLIGGATFWQAVGAYFVVTVTLATINITAALLARKTDADGINALGTMDSWSEWHEQEDWRDAELEAIQEGKTGAKKRRAS